MNPLRAQSISGRLTAAFLLTNALSLAVAGLAFVTYDVINFRRTTIDSLLTLARVIAENSSAALSFSDAVAAMDTLNGLRAESQIEYAVIVNRHNQVFATYQSSTAATQAQQVAIDWAVQVDKTKPEGAHVQESGVIVHRQIHHRGETLGFVVLRANLHAVRSQFYWKLGILGIVLMIAGTAAYVLAGCFRRRIAGPIIALEEGMLRFSRDHSPQPLVQRSSNDEIGRLIDGFNDMVKQIHARDQELNLAVANLHVAKNAAEAADQAKSRFIATLSHEVRNPMTGVLAMTDVLVAEGLNPKQTRHALIIRRSADNVLQFLSNALDYSRIESGRLTLEHIDFSPRSLVADVLDALAETARAKGIGLECYLAPDVPAQLCGDPVRLRQILDNLVRNGIKFTFVGSVCVRVNVRYGVPNAQRVRLVFTIADTGMGIAEDVRPYIFLPFRQADASTARRFGGSGLGLAITRELVELMGGQITVESTLGSGSVFTVDLPFAVSVADSQNPPKLRAESERIRLVTEASPAVTEHLVSTEWTSKLKPHSTSTVSILVAEDNEVTREVAHSVFVHLGCRTELVDDGDKAIAAAQTGCFDLIVMDLHMPTLDGVSAARAIRERERSNRTGKRVPIILTTAAMRGISDQGEDGAIDDYLVKPYRLHQVIELFNRWLPIDVRSAYIEFPTSAYMESRIGSTIETVRSTLTPSAHDAHTQTLLIDESVLDGLEKLRQEGRPRLTERVVPLFCSHGERLIATLTVAIDRYDAGGVFVAAHSLHNLGQNVGASALSALCRTLEQSAGRVEWEAIVATTHHLRACFDATAQQLLSRIGNSHDRSLHVS